MGLQRVSCGGSRQPASGVLVPPDQGRGSGGIQLALQRLLLLLKLQDLGGLSANGVHRNRALDRPTFFCRRTTLVHFFSSRPSYFLRVASSKLADISTSSRNAAAVFGALMTPRYAMMALCLPAFRQRHIPSTCRAYCRIRTAPRPDGRSRWHSCRNRDHGQRPPMYAGPYNASYDKVGGVICLRRSVWGVSAWRRRGICGEGTISLRGRRVWWRRATVLVKAGTKLQQGSCGMLSQFVTWCTCSYSR